MEIVMKETVMPVFRQTSVSRAVQSLVHRPGLLPRHSLIAGMLVPAIFVIGSGGVLASTTWTGNENDDWFDADNWSDGAPDDQTDAEIERSSSGDESPMINAAGAETNAIRIGDAFGTTLSIENDGTLTSTGQARIGTGYAGSLAISGPDAAWIHEDINLAVGIFNVGTVSIEDGASAEHTHTSGTTRLGSTSSGRGTVTVSGAGSTLSGNSIHVGSMGEGNLEISDGATATHWDAEVGVNQGSDGSVVVNDAAWDIETYMVVGGSGSGELTIENGGEVSTANTMPNSQAYLGLHETGSGTAVVTGSASSWTTTGLEIGWHGEGELTLENDGEITSSNVSLGRHETGRGTATVTGSNSFWTVQGALSVGHEGRGELQIQSGAELVTGHLASLGHGSNSYGEVHVTGNDSGWRSEEDLFVGGAGDGTLRITDGGGVDAGEAISAGHGPDSTGDILVDGTGSILQVTGQGIESYLAVGRGGTGHLEIRNGGRAEIDGDGVAGVHEGSSGEIVIHGIGSEWSIGEGFYAGLHGDAIVRVEDGGAIDVAGNSVLGSETSASAEMIVSGTDTLWRSDAIRVGHFGDADLEIRDGARVESHSMSSLAVHPGSSATARVTGTDTHWDVDSMLRVGNSGTAELHVEDGATIHSNSGWIGFNDRGEGFVYLSGDDSRWDVSQDLRVGYNGKGYLEIGPDSEVSAGNQVIVADDAEARGTMVVNGTLVSGDGVEVNAGGRLQGDGTVIGDTSIRGQLAPGNSIGSLAINGDLTLAGDAVYIVEVNDGGDTGGVNNDHVSVDGDIHIEDDASVHVTAENGTEDGSSWAPETTYTILESQQVVHGEFAEVTDDFAFLSPELAYAGDHVTLTLTQVADLADAARTRNQRSVGNTLDEQTQNPAMDGIVGAIITMDGDSARAALDDLSGVDHTHAQQIAVRGGQRFRAGLMGRLTGHAGTSAPGETASLEQLAGVQLASAGQPRGLLGEDAEPSRGWWVSAEGGRGDIDDTSNATGADYRFHGLSVGFDAPVSDSLHVGAAMGYVRNRADTAGGDVDVDSIHLAGYGGWQHDALYVRGSIGMAYHSTDTERFVETAGQTAEADYSARGVGSRVEAGYAFEMGETATLTPFGGLDYEYLRRSRFSESGAGAANLEVDRESEYSLRSQAGVRFDQAFDTTGGYVAPYVEAAWVHEHGDRSSRMNTAFAGDTATGFTIEGPRLSRDRARIQAGVDARLNEDSFLNVGYHGEIASSDDLHAIGLTFRRNW